MPFFMRIFSNSLRSLGNDCKKKIEHLSKKNVETDVF